VSPGFCAEAPPSVGSALHHAADAPPLQNNRYWLPIPLISIT